MITEERVVLETVLAGPSSRAGASGPSGAVPASRVELGNAEPSLAGHPRVGWIRPGHAGLGVDELLDQGLILFTSTGQPSFKRHLDESKGSALQSIWTDVNPLNPQARERVNYPTQKPLALLERIIETSSNPGDLFLDCFVGSSGTGAVAAEKLGRRWIAADLGQFSIHATRKRLLSLPDLRPFVVENLGKYERQLSPADSCRAIASRASASDPGATLMDLNS